MSGHHGAFVEPAADERPDVRITAIMSATGGVAASSHPNRQVRQMPGRLEALYPLACAILAAFAFAFNRLCWESRAWCNPAIPGPSKTGQPP
jgi:hypothetical protein